MAFMTSEGIAFYNVTHSCGHIHKIPSPSVSDPMGFAKTGVHVLTQEQVDSGCDYGLYWICSACKNKNRD